MTALLVLFLLCAAQPAMAWSRLKMGLIDEHGKELVPCQHRAVRYLGCGLYYLEDSVNYEPFNPASNNAVVDSDGKPVSIHVPEGCILSGVFIPERAIRRFWSDNKSTLPPESILEIRGKDGFGICTPDGGSVLAPNFEFIQVSEDGEFCFFAKRWPSLRLRFGEASKTYYLQSDGCLDQVLYIEAPSRNVGPGSNYSAVRGDHENSMFWGFRDDFGQAVIKPRFDFVRPFSEGLARAYMHGSSVFDKRLRFIDATGNVVSPIYLDSTAFKDGLAVVSTSAEKHTINQGVVNKKFEWILKPRYNRIVQLYGQVFAVRKSLREPFKAVTISGNTLFEFPLDVKDLKASEGLISCIFRPPYPPLNESELYGRTLLMDQDGKTVYQADDARLNALADGIAVVSQHKPGAEVMFSIIDKSGLLSGPVAAYDLEIINSKRLIKKTWDTSFIPELWKSQNNQDARIQQFACFLRNYDLIGMSRVKVEELLGVGPRYELAMFNDRPNTVEIQYDGSVVKQWRLASQNSAIAPEPWVTTNSVYDFTDVERFWIFDHSHKLYPKYKN